MPQVKAALWPPAQRVIPTGASSVRSLTFAISRGLATGGGCVSALEQRELIAVLLWLEVTAARTAKKARVQPSTLAKYERIIGERIAAAREAELEKFEVESIVYSDGWKVCNWPSLNGLHHKRINHDKTPVNGKVHIKGLESFRGYSKRRLKAHHGGFKRNFSLFIREMEFSFNHRNDPGRLDYPNNSLIGP
ncbi:MAG: hypothetical protein GF399_03720 [Candidatus Coatesbacteria bacterium]|nr:hypothetical protein [Candidatus Coatesbacteria bacterium]